MTAERPVALVTGATGFIGRETCRALARRGWSVRAAVRSPDRVPALPDGVTPVLWDMEGGAPPDPSAMRGVRAVLHLAGRAHQMGEAGGGSLDRYRSANVAPTALLVRAAREAGVRRFVYVSSVKVMGEGGNGVLHADDPPAPVGAYAVSKAEAEEAVRTGAAEMEWTIVRPTFVYGPGGKGNFPPLVALARLATRLPLPLGGIRNRRSIVFVENLADLLVHCAAAPAAARRTLIAADAPSVSTPALLGAIATALGRRVRLFPVPAGLLRLAATLAGRGGDWSRLAGSLEVDVAPLAEIGWGAPYSLDAALARTVAAPPSEAR